MGAETAIDSTLVGEETTRGGWLPPIMLAAAGLVAGLALARLLYEWRFPEWLILSRPLPVFLFAATMSLLAGAAARHLNLDFRFAVAFLPLAVNLYWLFDPIVDPARGRFIFAAGIWLTIVLIARQLIGDDDLARWRWFGPLFIAFGLFPVYLLTMSTAVGEADTFEFQVVAPTLGIAHPTGYPLYLLLGKLFSAIPLNTVAWRVNFASSVFAVAAAAIVFLTAIRLTRRPLPALTGAMALGLAPVFWMQAIIAEVYTLHALIVAVALRLMIRIVDEQRQGQDREQRLLIDNRKALIGLAFVLGLGLTNHLTTVFLLPPAALTFLIYARDVARNAERSSVSSPRAIIRLLVLMLLAFFVPLLLYLYLPWRWQVVNQEAMGLGRFIDWVIGGRFQGALQWDAWWRDPARLPIVGRLVGDAWGWVYLALAVIGAIALFKRLWPAAMVLLLTAVGYVFYSLNYYVPDLAVFLIPAYVVIAIWVAAGVALVLVLLERSIGGKHPQLMAVITVLVFVVALFPALQRSANLWGTIDQSGRDGGERWAREALAQPLTRGAAILADSEKIAPLYYLQQIEGLRPDLNIIVLPDEATYRAELDARLAAGQAVYLARFLPGLEGVYHLRSDGPLVEVSSEPLLLVPDDITPADWGVGPLRLLGYRLGPAPVTGQEFPLTLFWSQEQAPRPGEQLPVLYLRWFGEGVDDFVVPGRHPVNNYYPVNAWRPGEIVVDTHTLPVPIPGCNSETDTCSLELQIAAAPRFSAPAELTWQTIASVEVTRGSGPIGRPIRAFFAAFALDGVDLPGQARPGTQLPVRYSGYGDGADLSFRLVPAPAAGRVIFPADEAPEVADLGDESSVFGANLEEAGQSGPHVVVALPTGQLSAVCHWLARPTTGCIVGEIAVSGAPLTAGAVNFDDRIALLDIDLPKLVIEPGGLLPVEITWQGLASMAENYTVFVQVLDDQDRIIGQVDAWPVQGTYPTSQWRPGETVRDPYVIRLSDTIGPGDFRIHVGLYLLATLQRLPVIDEDGRPVDDKVEMRVLND